MIRVTRHPPKAYYIQTKKVPFTVDLVKRRFVFDILPLLDNHTQVGTIDWIANDVQKFLNVFGSTEKEIRLSLVHNVYLNGPGLKLELSQTSQYGILTTGTILVLSHNVQDIFQLLQRLNICDYHLRVVHPKYLVPLRDFLSSTPLLRKLCMDALCIKHDPDLGMIRHVLQSSTSLATLAIEYRSRHNHEVLAELFCDIHNSQSLTKLELHIKCLTPDMMDGLVYGLPQAPQLKVLDMRVERSAHPTDISKIARALRNNNTIKEWNISGRILQNYESIRQSAKLVHYNQNLQKLDLRLSLYTSKCWIHPDAWIYMGRALASTRSLQYLDLSYNRISEESWKALAHGLKVNTSLLTFKAIRPRVYKDNQVDILLPIFEALRDNQTMESLNLSGFDLSKSLKSLQILGSVLGENQSLKSLDLVFSGLTDEGAEILSQSLPKMKFVQQLHLGIHDCTVQGARAFAKGMKGNHSLLSVNFGGKFTGSFLPGYAPPMGANGFEKEFHEIEYYARMNRKGRRCMGSKTPVFPSLWPLVLQKAQHKEKSGGGPFITGDVRNDDCFGVDRATGKCYDTSIDAVFYLLRDVITWPIL